MKKPEGVGEWDGYPMPDIPPNRKPLSKEEEERISAQLRENVRKHAIITDNRQAKDMRKIG